MHRTSDSVGDDRGVEQGASGAASPGTKGGKTRPAGGEVQTSAVPEERYETESRDYVFYRSRTICSVSAGGFDTGIVDQSH